MAQIFLSFGQNRWRLGCRIWGSGHDIQWGVMGRGDLVLRRATVLKMGTTAKAAIVVKQYPASDKRILQEPAVSAKPLFIACFSALVLGTERSAIITEIVAYRIRKGREAGYPLLQPS